MLRTSGLVSANQRCSTRATFKQSVSPAGLRQRTVRVTRAEPENTSVAGGSITNEGETKPDSYEVRLGLWLRKQRLHCRSGFGFCLSGLEYVPCHLG